MFYSKNCIFQNEERNVTKLLKFRNMHIKTISSSFAKIYQSCSKERKTIIVGEKYLKLCHFLPEIGKLYLFVQVSDIPYGPKCAYAGAQ